MSTLAKRKKTLILLANISILSLFVFSCVKHNHPWVTQTKPVKPSFILYEPFYGTTRKFPTDTIISHRVGFASEGDFDSCQWIVGSDPTIRTQRNFQLTFLPSEFGQTIPVTFVAYSGGKSDTTRKSVTVMGLKKFDDNLTPYTIDPIYVGKFSGNYLEEPSHKFDVSIANFGPYPFQYTGAVYWDFRIFNLPEGCGSHNSYVTPCKVDSVSPYNYAYEFETTYRAFYLNVMNISTCCPPALMYGYIDSVDRNKITIEYKQLSQATSGNIDTILKRTFVGYRQ